MGTIESQYLVAGVIFSFGLSYCLTALMRRLALIKDITDKPDGGRKSQKEPVPYLGGLAISLSVIITILVGSNFISLTSETKADLVYLLFPATILSLVGLWDDIRELSPQFRLMVQVILGLAGSLTITFGSTAGSATGNQNLDLLLTIFWIVGITNALNFFDNLDGGAAVACFMSALGLFLYSILTDQMYLASFGVILMGVMLGFFVWNRRPARIYMGDSGALFLGMLLATITVRIDPQTDSNWAALSVPIFLLALPIIDTSTVVVNRILNKRSPLQGGKDHLSHRLALKGLRHRYVLYVFAGISLLLQLPIFLYLEFGKLGEYFVFSTFLFAMIITGVLFSRIQIKYEKH